jgi:anti-sigma regulatory factor (Ser/Thr protein kinase)
MLNTSTAGSGTGNAANDPNTVRLAFPSSSEYLALVRSAVGWFADKCQFSDKDCSRIVLAVVEATTNIIRHAYGSDPNQTITLRMTHLEGGLELEFLDQGKSVEGKELEKEKVEKLEPGGLGVQLMKSCMDHFQYEKRAGGGSRLILRKLKGPPCEAKPR